jgi:hypothetical protein
MNPRQQTIARRLKASSALGLIILTAEITGIALLLLCGQTIYSTLRTLTPDGEGEIPVSVDERTQVATLTYTSTPSNGGFLATRLRVGLSLALDDGSYSARNDTSTLLQPGGSSEVKLTLKVPVSTLRQFADGYGRLEVYTSLSTLNDLVTLGLNSKSVGGT